MPGALQRGPVGGAHVEMRPVAGPGAEEGRALRAEGLPQIVAHLVAAGADAGPERGQQVLGARSVGQEGLTAARGDPGRGAAPARVGGGHGEAARVDDEHGQAVGGFDAEDQSRSGGDRRVGLGVALEGRLAPPGAVHLLEREQSSLLAEGGRDAPSRLVARFGGGRGEPPLEAVDEPRHRREAARGRPRGARAEYPCPSRRS